MKQIRLKRTAYLVHVCRACYNSKDNGGYPWDNWKSNRYILERCSDKRKNSIQKHHYRQCEDSVKNHKEK